MVNPKLNTFLKSYRVITYDFLGHGQSPLPKNDPTLDDYVEQLNNLVDTIGVSNFSLVGHSMGAIISVAFARKFPLKVNALVPLNIVFNRSEKGSKRCFNESESSYLHQTKYLILKKHWSAGLKIMSALLN